MESKLGVVVPLRSREEQLPIFIKAIKTTLEKQKINHVIIIVEQNDNKPFNRGKLLNIGSVIANKHDCTYLAFHDVDMIPHPDRVDYSTTNKPIHLATHIYEGGENRETFDEYFGGVVLFPIKDFYQINGFSNEYWGWGFEDDDLLYRCLKEKIRLTTKRVQQPQTNMSGYKFNGHDSRIELPMPFGLRNYTMLVSVEPFPISCREWENVDEYSITSIPENNTGFSYNSFKRFKFETLSSRRNQIVLNSDIVVEKRSVLVSTVDTIKKEIKFYQDGKLISEHPIHSRILTSYHHIDKIMLGQPQTWGEGKRPFEGIIDYFALWNHSLEAGQVKAVSDKLYLGLNENFDGYDNAHAIEMCYDMKIGNNHEIRDLSKRNAIAKGYHCDKTQVRFDQFTKNITVPYRRESLFMHLDHDSNGFADNKWKFKETRKNQLRFYNKVKRDKINYLKEGLSSLEFTLTDEQISNDIVHLKVNI
jgi:hypothetical protein